MGSDSSLTFCGLWRVTKMLRGPEQLLYEERLRKEDLLSLKRPNGNFSVLQAGYYKDGVNPQ